jgi:membrane fusion protein
VNNLLPFVISSEKQTSAGDTQAALSRQIILRRDSMESERKTRMMQEQERIASISSRVAALDAEAAKLGREIALQQSRLHLSMKDLERHQHLADSGFISALQLQQNKKNKWTRTLD